MKERIVIVEDLLGSSIEIQFKYAKRSFFKGRQHMFPNSLFSSIYVCQNALVNRGFMLSLPTEVFLFVFLEEKFPKLVNRNFEGLSKRSSIDASLSSLTQTHGQNFYKLINICPSIFFSPKLIDIHTYVFFFLPSSRSWLNEEGLLGRK